MGTRLSQLESRISTVRAQSDEVWKTLETAEGTLLQMLTVKDYDWSGYFGENAAPTSRPPETASLKLRADRHETEEFYLTVSIKLIFIYFISITAANTRFLKSTVIMNMKKSRSVDMLIYFL